MAACLDTKPVSWAVSVPAMVMAINNSNDLLNAIVSEYFSVLISKAGSIFHVNDAKVKVLK